MAVVGIIGGTFDPVHYGHLRLAEDAKHAWPLDRLLFIPAQISPLKLDRQPVSPAHRLAFTRLAVADRDDAAISDVEVTRPGPSFMVDTLAALRSEMPNDEFVLVLGMDAYETFTQWKNWKRITQLASLFVGSRPGSLRTDPANLFSIESAGFLCYDEQRNEYVFKDGKSLRFFDTTPLAISSTALRETLKRGGSIRYLVPPAVEAYIRDNNLYQA